MNIGVRDITDRLTRAGIKPSAQRIAIMRYMLTHRTHPTVDEIYRALIDEYPTMSRTTVYNTLRVLVEKGCVLGLDIDSNNTRYDGFTEPHAHFLCKCCGNVIDVPLESALPLPAGMHTHEAQVYFKGVCDNCIKTNN